MLIHNSKGLKAMGKECTNPRICDRTGKPHHKWRPIVSMGKVSQYVTGEEREYPKGFCDCYAVCLDEEVKSGHIRSFLEVYSGPNAPLSNSVSERFAGRSIPRKDHTPRGREFQHLEEVQKIYPPELPEEEQSRTTVKDTTLPLTNRANALYSGRQPSFGKRKQLIMDGINHPLRHLKEASTLRHPFDQEIEVKPIHMSCLKAEVLMDDPIKTRSALLEKLESLSLDPEVRRRDEELKGRAGIAFTKLGMKLNLGLMERVQKEAHMEDSAIPLLCSVGLPITGLASESPFFVRHEEPQKVSLQEFTNTCKRRRTDSLRRTQYMGSLGGPEMGMKIREKLDQEILEGTMGPASSLEYLEQKYGPTFNIIPSFGLKQGVNSKGQPKYRRIDDHSAGWVNHAAKRTQKIPMANADYIALMLRSHSEQFPGEAIHVGTADMKSAYRQVPLCDNDLKNSITAVYHPGSPEPTLHEMFGQPFGAGHAVPNFYRFAEWFQRFVCRYFSISCDHFFDDFWIVSREHHAEHALQCLLRSAELMGIVFDSDKTQNPTSKAEVLGVIFNTLSLGPRGSLFVQPRPSRVRNLSDTIDECVAMGVLTPSQAASIVGKFGFLCSTMFGKAGRCASLGVRSRQYSSSLDSKIFPSLETSLRLMQKFLEVCPPRELRVQSNRPPFILYTDASDVPERSPRFGVGAVLIDNTGPTQRISYFSWSVPSSLVD